MSNWLAFGKGIGIAVLPDELRVAVVRIRPSGVESVAEESIKNYTERPAAEWGAQYQAFLRSHGAAHLAATVVLPRREVTMRVLTLPGVADKELAAALALQIDTLHPYPEADVVWSWTKLKDGKSLLIGITRRSGIDRYMEKFAEAGIKIGGFSFTGALTYTALRLYGAPPSEGFVAWRDTERGLEVYGESQARPLYAATFDSSWETAIHTAVSELRLTPGLEPREFTAVLPSPRRAPEGDGMPAQAAPAYLAGIAAAAPRLGLKLNLLPEELRDSSSLMIYVPTVVLGVLLVIGLAALGLYSRYEDGKYLEALQAEIAMLEPKMRQLEMLDKRAVTAAQRIAQLDEYQQRTKLNLDALRETTRLIPPPGWLNTLELSGSALVVAGEADQATGLLKSLDSSPMFSESEFLVPIARVGNAEVFRIRSKREGMGTW
ncbi:MAG: hypothetical protein JNK87_16035 [Bryobacterales bacterium]|nr:hypothetical protein [Bryobacterales bacterium]